MGISIAAAYIRVSTDDQVEYSPESQVAKIKELAKREGYIIPDEYFFRDEGISGKSADKRPAFRLMIATAKQQHPPFDRIYVWEFSRFARNQEESIMYKNLLKKKGISVHSVREPLNDSPFASLIERIIEWMDEYYLINLAEEVRRGMGEKARRGEAMGAAPYGYTCKDKVLHPDDHAETVRNIFRAYADGKPIRAITSDLAAAGVRTTRGNVPDNRWVSYILSNTAYIGKTRWSTEGHANYDRPNYCGDNVMLVDGKHDAIIDQKLWDVVQDRLKQRRSEPKYVRTANPRIFALKGLLRCGSCGATLTYCSTAAPSLQCHKYAKGQCHESHSITLAKATATVVAALEDMAARQSYNFAPRTPKADRIVHQWDKLIAAEQSKLRRARDAMLEGVFTPAEYKDIRDEITRNIEQLETGKAAEAPDSAPVVNLDEYTAKVLDVLHIVKSPEATEEQKNQALRSIVDKIVYHKDPAHFEIFLNT